MKILGVRFLVVFVLLAGASFAVANPFKSKIITSSALQISVPSDHSLKITNFSQEGGTDRGVVAVTFNGEGSSGTANVLTAIRIDFSTGGNYQNFPEIANKVIIAGPGTITNTISNISITLKAADRLELTVLASDGATIVNNVTTNLAQVRSGLQQTAEWSADLGNSVQGKVAGLEDGFGHVLNDLNKRSDDRARLRPVTQITENVGVDHWVEIIWLAFGDSEEPVKLPQLQNLA